MQTTTIDTLKFYNTGFSRSRITLVTPAEEAPGPPRQIAGTRWLVFGESAAGRLQRLVANHSWPKLDERLEPVGGFSANIWVTMHHRWELLEGEVQELDDCQLINFGQRNSRVLLVGPVPPDRIFPARLGNTAVIALSPAAQRCFLEYLDTLPGDTGKAHYAAAGTVPGGLSAYTIQGIRRATSGKR